MKTTEDEIVFPQGTTRQRLNRWRRLLKRRSKPGAALTEIDYLFVDRLLPRTGKELCSRLRVDSKPSEFEAAYRRQVLAFLGGQTLPQRHVEMLTLVGDPQDWLDTLFLKVPLKYARQPQRYYERIYAYGEVLWNNEMIEEYREDVQATGSYLKYMARQRFTVKASLAEFLTPEVGAEVLLCDLLRVLLDRNVTPECNHESLAREQFPVTPSVLGPSIKGFKLCTIPQ